MKVYDTVAKGANHHHKSQNATRKHSDNAEIMTIRKHTSKSGPNNKKNTLLKSKMQHQSGNLNRKSEMTTKQKMQSENATTNQKTQV